MKGALDCAHAREVAQAARDLRISEKTLQAKVAAVSTAAELRVKLAASAASQWSPFLGRCLGHGADAPHEPGPVAWVVPRPGR